MRQWSAECLRFRFGGDLGFAIFGSQARAASRSQEGNEQSGIDELCLRQLRVARTHLGRGRADDPKSTIS